MSALDYSTMTHDAALRFLQTAIVVDDAATVETKAERTGTARDPGLEDRIGASAEPEKDESDSESETGSSPPAKVDVKGLADVLADLGITCGVLRPKAEEGVETVNRRIAAVSARVDLVVLDWMLDEDTQLTSLKAIQDTVKADRRGCRVIAIYTSQSNLSRIGEELSKAIPDIRPVDQEESMFSIGGTRIALIRKAEETTSATDEGGEGDDAEDPYESLTVAELGPRIVDIFREAVEGWVRTVALNTMAAMRENFHAVLDRLDPALDVGYAGHLLRLDHVDDGAGQLLDSIGGELRGVVEDDQNSQASADPEAFEAWIAHRNAHDELAVPSDLLTRYAALPPKEQESVRDEAFTALQARNALPNGVGKSDVGRSTTALFIGGDSLEIAEGSEADGRFAILMAMRHRYGNNEPMLRLGTVVSNVDGTKYWLCIQPDCDSVRLVGKSLPFPFIPLTVIAPEEKGTAFHLVVPSIDSVVRLFNPAKAATVAIYQFKPKPDTETVCFRFDKVDPARSVVKSTGDVSFYWVGQLKPAHAARVAHRLGEAITRIGLDESEWLRKASQLKGLPKGA